MSDHSEITIRPAIAADAATIHALTLALAESTEAPGKVSSKPENFLEHGFSEEPRFEALLAETSGKAVGLCLYFYTFSSWRGETGIYIQDLYVSDDLRGTGLGRQLLAETVRRADRKGATHLRLCVDHDNSSAQDFYSAVGMKLRDDDYVFEADGRAFSDLGHL